MDDGTALLAAIRLHPDEDVPRLAYADWLDEHGQPERAEFCRVQCELAKMGHRAEGLPCGDCDPLLARERQLLDAHWLEWNIEFMASIGFAGGGFISLMDVVFRRGFVESITCGAADWLTHADAILASHPITEVTFTSRIDWEMRNYDAYLFERYHYDPVRRLCRPMHPDLIDKALAEGIEVVLRHEWPGVRVWNYPSPIRREVIVDEIVARR